MKFNETMSQQDAQKKQSITIEIITLLLYAGALLLIMYYHEPWFDEAQAWLIARDASVKELVTSITHYEGHPPVWFLILMPLAKLGVPFEIGVKSVNFIFATAAMGIFIFKAPFSRLIRCTVPFTYFFFYQYGVISRPYSLMMLGFILSALTYKHRNVKPYYFAASLSLLCSASAYGMVIAAGISLVWLWEVLCNYYSLNKIKTFFNSKSFYALSILLIYNILLLLSIYPYSDTYATNAVPLGSRLFFAIFIAPAEATFFNTIDNNAINNNIYFAVTSITFYITLTYLILYKTAKIYGKQALLVVPYLMFILFGGIVYFSNRHVGIITMFYLFFFWCCFDEGTNNITQNSLRLDLIEHKVGLLVIYTMIAISIYWSINASIKEISLKYGTGRETAEFITDNKLDQKYIMAAWVEIVNPDTGEKYQDYNYLPVLPALAYFDNNIFYNLNNKLDNKCYMSHRLDTNGYYTKELIKNNYPDVLIGNDEPGSTFGNDINMNDFAIVKSVHGNTIWKNTAVENRQFIYIRKDLLKDYPNLTILNIEEEKIPDE
jgi:hypothetical protein